MPIVEANGIDIHYEEIGSGEPLLLVMGLGAQLVLWPKGFCELLAAQGFRVIRFDNRDVGLSTKLSDLPAPKFARSIVRAAFGLKGRAPYSLRHMADDVAGLLDALAIDSAHLVGCSLGGMIAQSFAIAHPTRIRTLTSIMSSPGGRRYALSKPRSIRALLESRPSKTAREAEERHLNVFRIIGSPSFAHDEQHLRDAGRISFERCPDMRGMARQYAAIAEAGSRVRALGLVRVPSLVIHGAEDPLILPWAGRATARAIPGAKLRIIKGMGHDLPPDVWGTIVEDIVELARKAPQPTRERFTAEAPAL